MRSIFTLFIALFIATNSISQSEAWTKRWNHAREFKAVGTEELKCNGQMQSVSCCVCNTIVQEIETQLNNTKNDHDVDVKFRISEKKKKIKYSRSEKRIMEVLEKVCESVPPTLQIEKKAETVVKDACKEFVNEYEEQLTESFFDNFTPAQARVCTETLNVCNTQEPPQSQDEL